MEIVGIICEYDPFHLGHRRQIRAVREQLGEDCAVVCLMSGNYVQRGHPAMFDKMRRAQCALLGGADLVLELPVQVSLSSAEGFAAGGVRILSPICTRLSFGSEIADANLLLQTAEALLRPDFSDPLRQWLDKGLSFPAARAAALEDLGLDARPLCQPNSILAVEYCKAILSQNSPMAILPITREGRYHAAVPEGRYPSATAVRSAVRAGGCWQELVPPESVPLLSDAPVHTLSQGETAVLARLRAMTDAEFEALPYGSEGLWRKLMHESRRQASLEDIAAAVKSRRYTRSRLDRMIMCAFLGLTGQELAASAPYARILGFTQRGRTVLNTQKKTGLLQNIGQNTDHPQQALEDRCDRLYGLFARQPERADFYSRLRVLRSETEGA